MMKRKELSLQDLHVFSVEILSKIDLFCKQNRIRYSLGYGSLLGAIRHKGFIPWDDDIDLLLPRPDYDRFVNTFQVEGLKCVAPEVGNSYLTFGRVVDTEKTVCDALLRWADDDRNYGVWIDVFAMDGEPDDPNEFSLFVKKCQEISERSRQVRGALQKLSWSNSPIWNLKLLRKRLLYGMLDPRAICEEMSGLLKTCPYVSSEYAGLLSFPVYGLKNRTRKEVFESYTTAVFEGQEFSILAGYDEFLHDIYGDYMKLPPAEQQVPKHSFHKFYWK